MFTRPEFSLNAMLSVALPLFLITLTGQYMPGMLVLRNDGFKTSANPIVTITGLGSLLMAPFGSHAFNIAAITAAICTGRESHEDPSKRWIAGIAAGVFYILVGVFGVTLAAVFMAFPATFITTLAGLALLGTIGGSLAGALADPKTREASLITFLAAAANIKLFGIGGAFWGLCIGLLAHLALNGRWPGRKARAEAGRLACGRASRACRRQTRAGPLSARLSIVGAPQARRLKTGVSRHAASRHAPDACLCPSTRHLRARQRRAVGRAGVEYLDAIAGVAVTSLGHGHPEIAAAIAEQAALLMHTSNVFRVEWQERLGQRLCALAGMERAFFCNSGAEANEAALKLARLHGHRRQAQPQIVVMENGFHGRTLATLSATGNPAKQRASSPCCRVFCACRMTISPPCASWRNSVTTSSPCCWSRCRARAASASPAPITCGTCALCDRHGWLLMLDEIQAGMGRTGAWFGHQHAGIAPDVMTLAKALGNGFPIGACLARGPAADLFSPGQHGSTFGGNPLACRVACTVLDIMARDGMPQRAAALGQRLLAGLRRALEGHPQVVAVRGQGLMAGIELDRNCQELVGRALAEQRLLITVTRERTIRLLPPLVCDEAQIDEIVARLARAVRRQRPSHHPIECRRPCRRRPD